MSKHALWSQYIWPVKKIADLEAGPTLEYVPRQGKGTGEGGGK
jgi:hypothetical protein